MSDPEEPGAERGPSADGGSPPPSASSAESKPKKRRRAKKEATAPAPLPGEGTPDGATLREANAAFEAGDYGLVRTLTSKLASAADPKVADAAADLARRVSVDPVQIGFLVACLVAIVLVFYVYVIR